MVRLLVKEARDALPLPDALNAGATAASCLYVNRARPPAKRVRSPAQCRRSPMRRKAAVGATPVLPIEVAAT